MPDARDVVIIGGGHNGLVTAFYLAKAGYKPLVLERRAQPGGTAITEEFYPGFRCSILAHTAGPLRPDIVRDMQLEKHGLRLITPEVGVVSLSPEGRALVLYNDANRSAQEIAKFSQKDAAKYPEFQTSLAKVGKVIGGALALAPPNIDRPNRGDLWGILQTGRSIRNLGKKDMYRLLRWGLALILGGAAGNALDRVLHGGVTDFLEVRLWKYIWPAFNVADSAITVGAVLVLFELLFGGAHARQVPSANKR